MSDSENEDDEKRRIRSVPILFAFLLFSPLMYLLSLGPAIRLLTPDSRFLGFYVLPAEWAYDLTGENAFWEMAEAYIEWWY